MFCCFDAFAFSVGIKSSRCQSRICYVNREDLLNQHPCIDQAESIEHTQWWQHIELWSSHSTHNPLNGGRFVVIVASTLNMNIDTSMWEHLLIFLLNLIWFNYNSVNASECGSLAWDNHIDILYLGWPCQLTIANAQLNLHQNF